MRASSAALRRAGNMVDRCSAVKSLVVTTKDCVIIKVATIWRMVYIQHMDFAGLFSRAMDDLHDSECFGHPGGERREHLEYLADLLSELQRMAEREGCPKLSRMLAISHAEAVREAHRRAA
jgi:hypothetical protein